MNISIFELLHEEYKITKPIRLIELFAGIGSQAKALQNIGANFEHYKVVEFDKYAVASYNAIHGTNFETSDITKISASELGIVETNKYEYILTYSFPCQDLSLAGKQKGMSKGDNTRSGLLWEVERLLDECEELPQILLMENVPEVIGTKNVQDFNKWQLKLEKIGYKNYHQVLNAKDYGIPQNRNRCFMISILGDYYYTFPQPQELKLRLKDMLENEVDEKFFLSEKMIKFFRENSIKNEEKGNGFRFSPKNADEIVYAKTITTNNGNRMDDNFIQSVGKIDGWHQRGVVYDAQGISPTLLSTHYKQPIQIVPYGSYYTWKDNQGNLNTQCNRACNEEGVSLTIPAVAGLTKVFENNLRIRKLTPKECWRLMGFDDEDFEKASKVNSNSQLYKQAGNSIVVPVLEAIFKELLL